MTMAPPIRAFIPSVDYADFLRVTLPANHARLAEIVVVTRASDLETIAVARTHGVRVHATEAWTADGADFNWARAIEHALDRFGRYGWILQLAADIVLPSTFPGAPLAVGTLYSARRRMLPDWPSPIPAEATWGDLSYHEKLDRGLSGYLLLWHAEDPHLPRRPPWIPINWTHVGGSDTEFIRRWPAEAQHWLPGDVLHLGHAGVDWCGRVQPRADGSVPAQARDRAERLEALLYRRRRLRRRGIDQHTDEKIRIPR